MFKAISDALLHAMAGRRRRVRSRAGIVKVNLGTGIEAAYGWLDDFEDELPFEPDSVDFIFCSHVLEHFFREDATRLLREMLRVLKPGGRVRICVPDLAHAVRLYQQGAQREALQMFFTGERGRFDQHRYMYDYHLLAALLEEQGFDDIRNCGFREGMVPDLDRLDNRPGETLFVEAAKSAPIRIA
jgi:predicted SAM-dependent methyltransferase